MSKPKTGRAPHEALARLITLDLQAFAAAHGDDKYIHLCDLADRTGLGVALTEEVARKMDGISIVPADDVIALQPDFPKKSRKGGEKGYYPGLKLETDGERDARVTRNRMILNASRAVEVAVAPLGLLVEFNAATGAFILVAQDEDLPDAVAAVLLATQETV